MLGKRLVIFALVFFWGHASFAERTRTRPDNMKKLDLSEEQKAQLKTIRESQQESMKAKREEIKERREKLKTLMDNNASEEEIKKEYDGIQKTRQEMNDSRFEKTMEIRKVLTPEQRKRFKAGQNDYLDGKPQTEKAQ